MDNSLQADIAVVDLDHPHLTPCHDPVFALVYAAQGFEVDTVLCAGDPVLIDREIQTLDSTLDNLMADATIAAEAIVDRVGIE